VRISATSLALAVTAAVVLGSAVADEETRHPDGKGRETEAAAKGEKTEPPPKPIQSATPHSVTIGGAVVAYTATTGTLIVRDEKDEPCASIGYIAYTRKDPGDLSRRPVTFAYNGGPGSSSIWLHMGVLGPRRVVTSDAAPTPPAPYSVVDDASAGEQGVEDAVEDRPVVHRTALGALGVDVRGAPLERGRAVAAGQQVVRAHVDR
jgi:carboxypeptidase C (cathepsin A)